MSQYVLDPGCTPPSVHILQCGINTCYICGSHVTCYMCSHVGGTYLNPCGPCSAANPQSYVPLDTPLQLALGGPRVIRDPGDLATLRAQLQDAIKVLDEHEKAGTLNPIKTKADAERVEAGITEALNQVREMKAKMK